MNDAIGKIVLCSLLLIAAAALLEARSFGGAATCTALAVLAGALVFERD